MNKTFVKRVLKDFIDLGEVEIKTGPFGTQLHASDYVEKGTSVINVRNIGYGRIKTEKLEYINEETVQRLSSHLLKHNDIVFGRKGAVDRHALIGTNQQGWFQGSDCLRIRIKSESLDPRYLSYCFLTDNHKKWMMAQCSHGATMASLNQDIISRISLSLPNIQIQKKIASILSSYDDLIENNTLRIEILEQMAKLVYEEWFVKFRFPGHENVKMVPSDLGEIPEGWKVTKLGSAVKLAYGKSLTAKNRTDGSFPVYGSAGVVGTHNEYMVNGPGIIIGRKGNVGSVFWSNESFFPIDTVFYVKTNISLHYVYYNLKNQNFINNDAAVPGLNRNQASSLPFLIPDDNILIEFGKNIDSIFKEIDILSRKNQNLRKTRELLLPKLISGEIDVSDLDIRIRNEFQES